MRAALAKPGDLLPEYLLGTTAGRRHNRVGSGPFPPCSGLRVPGPSRGRARSLLAPIRACVGAESWAGLSWILVSVWLLDLLGIGDPMAGQNSVLYPAIGTLIDSLLVWALFGGIGEYVTGRGPAEIALRASRLRVSFAVLATLALLSRIALPESSGLHDVAILIGLIAWIVWLVLSLRLVHRVRTEIAPVGQDGSERCTAALAVQPEDAAVDAFGSMAAPSGVFPEANDR